MRQKKRISYDTPSKLDNDFTATVKHENSSPRFGISWGRCLYILISKGLMPPKSQFKLRKALLNNMSICFYSKVLFLIYLHAKIKPPTTPRNENFRMAIISLLFHAILIRSLSLGLEWWHSRCRLSQRHSLSDLLPTQLSSALPRKAKESKGSRPKCLSPCHSC